MTTISTAKDDARRYFLRHGLSHAAEQQRWAELAHILLHPRFLKDKIEALGIGELLSDFDLIERAVLPEKTALELVQSALRISAETLAAQPSELFGQLLGRLRAASDPSIADLRARILATQGVQLELLSASMVPAGSVLERIYPGHLTSVKQIEWLDFDTVISAVGASLRMWKLDNGEDVAEFALNSDVQCFALASSKDRVFGVSKTEVRCFDLKHRTCLWSTDIAGKVVETIATNSEGSMVVLLTQDTPNIIALNGDSGDQFSGFNAEVLRSICVTPDGSRLLGGSIDGRIDVWDIRSGEELSRFAFHGKLKGPRATGDALMHQSFAQHPFWIGVGEKLNQIDTATVFGESRDLALLRLDAERDDIDADAVSYMAFSDDGSHLLTASKNGEAVIWSWPGGEQRSLIKGAADAVAIELVPGLARAVIASSDGRVRLWDLQSSTPLATFMSGGVHLIGLSVSPDGKRLIVVNANGDVECFLMEDRVPLPVPLHDGPITVVGADRECGQIITVGGGEVAVRTVSNLSERHRSAAIDWTPLSLSADGRRLLMHQVDNEYEEHSGLTRLLVFDPNEGALIQQVELSILDRSGPRDVGVVSLDAAACDVAGRRLVSKITGDAIPTAISGLGEVVLWDLESGTAISCLQKRAANAEIAMASDGSFVLVAMDGIVYRHSGEDGTLLETIALRGAGPMTIEPANQFAAVAVDDGLAWLFNSGQMTISNTPSDVVAQNICAMSGAPDRGRVAVSDDAGRLQLWSEHGGLLAQLTLDAPLRACTWSNDSELIASDDLGRLHHLAVRGEDESKSETEERRHSGGNATAWEQLDLARSLENEGDSKAALRLWLSLAELNPACMFPLIDIAVERLSAAGSKAAVAAAKVRLAINSARNLADRSAAIAHLETDRCISELCQIVDAIKLDGELHDGDESALIDQACRALQRLGESEQLAHMAFDADRAVMQRIFIAAVPAANGHSECLSLLEEFASDRAQPTRTVRIAQRLLLSISDKRILLPFLGQQANSAPSESLRREALIALAKIADIDRGALELIGGVDEEDSEVGLSPNALSTKAIQSLTVGDISLASRLLQRAVTIDPDSPVLHFNLGAVLLRRGDARSAVAAFSRAIELDPQYEKAFCERGTAHEFLKDYELAIADFSTAITLAPNHAFVYRKRADVYRTVGWDRLAHADVATADRLDPENQPPPEIELVRDRKETDVEVNGYDDKSSAVDAMAILKESGLDQTLAEELTRVANNTSAFEEVQVEAVHGLFQLGCIAELQAICHSPVASPTVRVLAAYYWADIEPSKSVRDWLLEMARDSEGSKLARHQAVQAICEKLLEVDLVALARSMPDLWFDEHSEMSVGLQLASRLLRADAERSGLGSAAQLVRDSSTPPPFRELASELLALSGDDRGFTGLETLASDRSVDAATRSAASRSLHILKSRRAPPKPTPQNPANDAYERLAAATSSVDVQKVVEAYPFVGQLEWVIQARLASAAEEDPKRKNTLVANLAQIADESMLGFDGALLDVVDAQTEAQVRVLADKHPILANSIAQNRLIEVAENYLPDGMQGAIDVRLRWLKSIPPDPQQTAALELGKCRSLNDVKELAKAHPIVATPGFIDMLEREKRNANSLRDKQQISTVLDWVLEVAGDAGSSMKDAEALYSQARYAECLRIYDNIIAGNPPRFAYFMRGLTFSALDRHEEAVADFTEVVKQGLDTPEVRAERGRSHMILKQWRPAISDFTTALEFGSEDPQVLTGRFLAYEFLGNDASSRADLERLVELDKAPPNLVAYLGSKRLQEGDRKGAKALAERAFAMDPNDDLVKSLVEALQIVER